MKSMRGGTGGEMGSGGLAQASRFGGRLIAVGPSAGEKWGNATWFILEKGPLAAVWR